jgi:putative membrane protein
VPLGYWLKDAFHLARNPFDRIGHFAFGFLGAYPFREALIRLVGVRGFWAYYLPLDVVLAMSAFYELLEAWAAQLFSPAMNDSILGLQGDFWDAQWDMTASFAGAIIALFLTWLIERRARKGDPVPSKRVSQR